MLEEKRLRNDGAGAARPSKRARVAMKWMKRTTRSRISRIVTGREIQGIMGETTIRQPQVRDMGIQEVLGTPRSPWQRAYVERVIGSIRRECLDLVLVFHETSLRRILRSYLDYYHRSRTHLSLGKDSPEPRSIQPEHMGRVVALPEVAGLHHRYERRAT